MLSLTYLLPNTIERCQGFERKVKFGVAADAMFARVTQWEVVNVPRGPAARIIISPSVAPTEPNQLSPRGLRRYDEKKPAHFPALAVRYQLCRCSTSGIGRR